jgi:hypothetical protein
MKPSYLFILILGFSVGCTGSNSSPGFHKTKERPSAAIEPTEKGNSTPAADPADKKRS